MIIKLTSTGLKPINESLNEASDNSDVFVWDGESEVPKDVVNVKIQDGVKEIINDAFSGCSSLISINLPNSITRIGDWAFYNCKSLTSITIPDGVTFIGDCAFTRCVSLANIIIPDGVKSIGESTFSGCSSLTSITIPNSVTSIGFSAFTGCSSLTSITIPDSVTRISKEVFSFCSNLTNVIIPDSVTRIGDYAFYKCSNLENIKLPKNVKLGKDVFKDCEKLENIKTSNSINIGNHYNKNNKSSIRLNNQNQTIIVNDDEFNFDDEFAFYYLPILKNIIITFTKYDGETWAAMKLPKTNKLFRFAHEDNFDNIDYNKDVTLINGDVVDIKYALNNHKSFKLSQDDLDLFNDLVGTYDEFIVDYIDAYYMLRYLLSINKITDADFIDALLNGEITL